MTAAERVQAFVTDQQTVLDEYATALTALELAGDEIVALETRVAELEEQLKHPPSSSPSGEAMPTGDLPGWRKIWADDFLTDVPLGQFPGQAYLNSVRVYPPTYYDTSNNLSARKNAGTSGQYNAATVVDVQGSVLRKHLHTEGVRPQVAALLPFIGGTGKWPGQLYGRYAIRARFPAAIPGYKVAWLLWPDSGTNTSGSPDGVGGNGEIDFPEGNLRTLTSVGLYVHYQNATVGSDQYAKVTTVDLTKWHTYVIEWAPSYVAGFIDGAEIGRATQRIPKTPMHWVIQTETEITATPPAVDVKGDVEIDWGVVWARA